MKKITLSTALALTTVLAACGGGGGGGSGSGSNVPVTSLSDINRDIVSMGVFEDQTNAQAREARVASANREAGNYTDNEVSGASIITSSYSIASTTFSATSATNQAYNSMYDLLISDKSFENLNKVTTAEGRKTLVKALVLAGFKSNELPATGLVEWVKSHSNEIKVNAQSVYDMYGSEKILAPDNAKLTSANIHSAKQDSFLSFDVDNNGKITGLNFEVDSQSAMARSAKFDSVQIKKDKDNRTYAEFTKVGPGYIYEVGVSGGNSIEYEFFEDPSKMNWTKLKGILLGRLDEEEAADSNKDFTALRDWINSCDSAEDSAKEFEKGNSSTSVTVKKEGRDDVKTTVVYKSYAKDGEQKLKYSDFGTTHIDGEEGSDDVDELFVFAGGYDAKKLDKSEMSIPTKGLEFGGKAVAAVIYQEYDNKGDRIDEDSEDFEGTANLKVTTTGSTIKENLTADFQKDGWYTVNVTTAADGSYDFNFSNGDKIENDDLKYKYGNKNEFSTNTKNMSKDMWAVEIGYFGNNGQGVPDEATGFVYYGEETPDGNGGAIGLHSQIGFGTTKK